ncbi:hypothetical protein GOBAR_DD09537 [Gossypium barbadense]|nr:hypothetical protein GOBAR_DD09537 [Gossypium barbadense]
MGHLGKLDLITYSMRNEVEETSMYHNQFQEYSSLRESSIIPNSTSVKDLPIAQSNSGVTDAKYHALATVASETL